MSDDPEFVFRSVQINLEHLDEEGRQVLSALTPPVCDFCNDTRVRWDYDCSDFAIPELPLPDGDVWGSTGGFAACDRCSQFIEGQAWDKLIDRVVRSWKAMRGREEEDAVRDATAIVLRFAEHYTPGRKAFG